MADHTPGTWEIGMRRQILAPSRMGLMVAQITTGSMASLSQSVQIDEAEAIANARLIAAAPDLLEVLKEATLALEGLAKGEGVFKPIEQTITLASAAIAKAEGRS